MGSEVIANKTVLFDKQNCCPVSLFIMFQKKIRRLTANKSDAIGLSHDSDPSATELYQYTCRPMLLCDVYTY